MAELERDRWLLAAEGGEGGRAKDGAAVGAEREALPSHGRELAECCQAIAPALTLIAVALAFTLAVPAVIHAVQGDQHKPEVQAISTSHWPSTTQAVVVGRTTMSTAGRDWDDAAASTSVFLTMRLENLDYGSLHADDSLFSGIQVLVAEEVATVAGHGVTPGDVAVALSPGSVAAAATVAPPAPSSAGAVRRALRSSTVLGISLAERLSALPQLSAASTGTVRVRDISVQMPTASPAVVEMPVQTSVAAMVTQTSDRATLQLPPQTSTQTSTQTTTPTSTQTSTQTSTLTSILTSTQTSTLTFTLTSTHTSTQTSTQTDTYTSTHSTTTYASTSTPPTTSSSQTPTQAPTIASTPTLTETTSTKARTPSSSTATSVTATTATTEIPVLVVRETSTWTSTRATTRTLTTTTVAATSTETATTTTTQRAMPTTIAPLERARTGGRQPPAPAPVAAAEEEEVLGPELDLSSAEIVYNNLGGMGPLRDEPEELRYGEACLADGVPVDVELVALGRYRPWQPSLNGLRGKYPNVNLAPGSFVDLSLQFVQSRTETPVTLSRVYLKIFDLGKAHKEPASPREVIVNGFDEYIGPLAYRFSHVSSISITLHAIEQESHPDGQQGRNFMLALHTGQSCINPADLPPPTTLLPARTTAMPLPTWTPALALPDLAPAGTTTSAEVAQVWGFRVEPVATTTAAVQEAEVLMPTAPQEGAPDADLESLRRDVAAAAKSAGDFGAAAAARPSVPLTLTVRNVDYALLMERPSLVHAFKASIKKAISSEAGNGITPENVALSLSPGSIIVWAAVYPPSGGIIFAVQSALGYSMTLPVTVLSEVTKLKGIEAASTGTISVVGVNVPPFTTRTTTKEVVTTATTTETRQGMRIASVPLSMKIQNLDYHRLSKDPAMLHEFRAHVKEAIASESGYATPVSGVSLILSEIAPHVVFVQASVTPLSNMILSLVRSRLSSSTSLSGTVAAWVDEVRGIREFTNGLVTVTDISVVWSSPPALPPAMMLPGLPTTSTTVMLQMREKAMNGAPAMVSADNATAAMSMPTGRVSHVGHPTTAATTTTTTTTISTTTHTITTTSTSLTTTTVTETDTVTTVTATSRTSTITGTTNTVTTTSTSRTTTTTTATTTTPTTTTATTTTKTSTSTTPTSTVTTMTTTTSMTTTTFTTSSTTTATTTTQLKMVEGIYTDRMVPMDGGDPDGSESAALMPALVGRKGPVAGVPVSLTVDNIDFGELSGDPTLLEAFNSTVREVIASEAGPSVFPEDVAVLMLPGSVLVKALVAPADGADLEDVRQRLEGGAASLGATLTARLAGLPGAAAAQTGAVGVRDVDISQVVTTGTPTPVVAHAGHGHGASFWPWFLAPVVLLAMCCCVPALGYLLRRCGFRPGGHRSGEWQRRSAWYEPVTATDGPSHLLMPSAEKALPPWPEVQRRPSYVSEAYGQPSLEALAYGLPPQPSEPVRKRGWEGPDSSPITGSWPPLGYAEEDFWGRPVTSPEDSCPPPPPPPGRPPHLGTFYPEEDLVGPSMDFSNGYRTGSISPRPSPPFQSRELPLIDLSTDTAHPRSDPILKRNMMHSVPGGHLPGSDTALVRPAPTVVAVEGAIRRSSSPYERSRTGATRVRPAAVIEARPLRARSFSPERPLAVVEGGPLRVVRAEAPARPAAAAAVFPASAQPLAAAPAPAVLPAIPAPRQPLPPALPGAAQTAPGRAAQVVSHVVQRPVPSSVMSSATVGLDLNLNGRTDLIVTGPDLNRDGIPDVLQQRAPAMVVPRAGSGSSTGDVVDRMLRMA